jgi:hypothetical protein
MTVGSLKDRIRREVGYILNQRWKRGRGWDSITVNERNSLKDYHPAYIPTRSKINGV